MFVAGKYKASPTAAPDGSDVQLAVDEYGKLRISATDLDVSGIGDTTDSSVSDPTASATLVSATKGTNELLAELLAEEQGGTPLTISVNASGQNVVNGPGRLLAVNVNTKGASSNVLSLFDSLTGSGTSLGVFDTTLQAGPLGQYGPKGARFGTGLTYTLATGTAANITLVYQPD